MSISEKVMILKPVITVFGVGGAGGNAINNMIKLNLVGARFVVANTDAQALEHSSAEHTIQLGAHCTKGLGAGASPEVGSAAAIESENEIQKALDGTNMLFITAGMGGGTGTGASHVIAKIAKEMDILTVGIVTKPFLFEGKKRSMLADSGICELQQYVDTLIVIPNQNLFHLANGQTSLTDAFGMADDVLYSGVRNVIDLIVKPGLINLDFADIKTIMNEMGKAMMGTGESEGDNRAIEATEQAISSPLLDQSSMSGATGVLINITGGEDMTLCEVDAAANLIREKVDPEANIIVGSTFDSSLAGSIRVSVVATGIDPIKSQTLDQKNMINNITEIADDTQKSYSKDNDIYEEVPLFDDQIVADDNNQVNNLITEQIESDSLKEEQDIQNDDFYSKSRMTDTSQKTKKGIFKSIWESIISSDDDDQNGFGSSKTNNKENDSFVVKDTPFAGKKKK